MKIKLFFLLLLVSTLITWAQTIVSPTYSRRDNVSIRINEVERTTQYTIIKGVCENVMHYGWACINSTTYLRDSKSGKNIGTISKWIFTNMNYGVRDVDVLQSLAARKHPISNMIYRVGNMDAL